MILEQGHHILLLSTCSWSDVSCNWREGSILSSCASWSPHSSRCSVITMIIVRVRLSLGLPSSQPGNQRLSLFPFLRGEQRRRRSRTCSCRICRPVGRRWRWWREVRYWRWWRLLRGSLLHQSMSRYGDTVNTSSGTDINW